MKIFLAFLFLIGLSVNPIEASAGPYKNVKSTSAPSSDVSSIGSHKPNAQEYIDTARTGQAVPIRSVELDGRCRDADGVWLHKEDIGYNACVREATRVRH